MRIGIIRNAASAQIQCCGVWLQIGGTIVGVFPERWFTGDIGPRSLNFRKLGVKVWSADRNGGTHTVFGVETSRWRVAYRRAFAEVSFTGHPTGWVFWCRRRAA